MAKLELAFDILARDKASQTLDKVGDKAQRTGEKVEHGSKRASTAFGLLGRTFASSSAGALGPLQELTDKFELLEQGAEAGSSKAGGRLLGLGLAATAAGSFIESLHSREQSALQQLQASIETTGQSYDTYAEDVEKAVKSGERFGNQASTTIDALNRLTVTTHNPEEAFKGLQVAIDVAAAKHVPLAKAAEQVGLIFNGSTRAGKQFGLKLEDVKAATQGLTAAQHASVSANTAVKNAQAAYTEKLDLWNHSATHSRAQAYALSNAHERLLEAQDKASAAAARLKTAHEKASDAAGAGARNVQKLAEVVKGQGAGAADTFTGHLKQLGAEIEDTLGKNGKIGAALVTVGAIGSTLGAVIQAGLFVKVGRSFKELRDVQVATSAEGAAAVAESAATIDTALATEGAAAKVAAGAVAGSSTSMIASLGKANLAIAAFLAGAKGILEFNKYARDHDLFNGNFYKGNDPLSNAIFGKKKSSLTPDQAATGAAQLLQYGDPTTKTTQDQLAALGYSAFGANNSDDDKRAMQQAAAHVATTLASTKTKHAKAGKDNGDAYLKALLAQLTSDKAASDAKAAAEKNAQAIIDAISGKFESARSRLQGLVSNALSLRQSVTSALQGGSALTDIFQGPDLNANGAFGKQNNFGRVKDFLQRRVAQERKFVLELRALIKEGLDPSLVAQIASAGVDGGQRIAEAILSGGKGGIGQVNSLERQIASLANTTGKSVADQHYAKQIAEQRRTTEVLGAQLASANAKLAAIQNNTTRSGKTDSSLVGV